MDQIVTTVHARFKLATTARVGCYIKDPASQDNPWIPVEGCKVTLNAVQGEPFGSATPNAGIDMVIANPQAAQMFLQVPLGAEFDVVFSPVGPE